MIGTNKVVKDYSYMKKSVAPKRIAVRAVAVLAGVVSSGFPFLVPAVPPVQFSPPVHSSYSNVFGMLALGDLNGDTNLDVVGGFFPGRVGVLLGNGDGTFTGLTNYTMDSSAGSAALADLNGDLNLDVITANASSISVRLGNGNGTFGPLTNFFAGNSSQSTVIGDFNNDTRPDVAVANATANTLSVLLGNGDGSFAPRVPYSVSVGTLGRLITADFNTNGALDLAVAGSDGSVAVRLGNGNGTFGAASNFVATFPYSFALNLQGLAATDFNRDGILDLVTANYIDRSSTLLLGDGSGSFHAAVTNYVTYEPFNVTTGDFNGDGIPDLATANNNSSNSVTLRLGDGDGTSSSTNYLRANARATFVTVTDLNHDTVPDVFMAANSTTNMFVFLNQTAPTLEISQADAQVGLTWPDWTGYQLESTTNLADANEWGAVTNIPVLINGRNAVSNSYEGDSRFYRLKK